VLRCLACGCRISREGLTKTILSNNSLVSKEEVESAFHGARTDIECFRCDRPFNRFVDEDVWEDDRHRIKDAIVQRQLDFSKAYEQLSRNLSDQEAREFFREKAEKYRVAARYNKKAASVEGDSNSN